MDWQQAASLLVVFAAAGLMVRGLFRKKTVCGQGGCGCSKTPGSGASFVLQARKGERAKVTIKL